MNLRSCKTNRRLWGVLSVLAFLAIGFAPLFRYGKGGDNSFVRLAPALVDFFRSGPAISEETIPVLVIIALWVLGAAALGWLSQFGVVMFLVWTHEKRTKH